MCILHNAYSTTVEIILETYIICLANLIQYLLETKNCVRQCARYKGKQQTFIQHLFLCPELC